MTMTNTNTKKSQSRLCVYQNKSDAAHFNMLKVLVDEMGNEKPTLLVKADGTTPVSIPTADLQKTLDGFRNSKQENSLGGIGYWVNKSKDETKPTSWIITPKAPMDVVVETPEEALNSL